MLTSQPQSVPDVDCAPHDMRPVIHPSVTLASFTHSVRTSTNSVKFVHHSLYNPKISTLLKAVCKGFLKGCPNLSEKLILKYLNPSPVMAKGLMKHPRHRTKNTRPRNALFSNSRASPLRNNAPPPIMDKAHVPAYFPQHAVPTLIDDDCNKTIAKVFCFGAFADRHSGVVYNDLMGNFSFMLFDGSVCFLVIYHYKANAIMATPITGLDDVCIFNVYKIYFGNWKRKGYKLMLNIMDNQATKNIKKFLTKKECKLQLVKLYNHWVIGAKRAIQKFKDAFISALATTDRDFP
jgi:hypothetical protein